MSNEALKPCPTPWCRSTDVYTERRGQHWARVQCKTCGVTTEPHYTEAAAHAQWNTRSTDTPVCVSREEGCPVQGCGNPSLGRHKLGHALRCAEHAFRLDNGDVAHGCEMCDGEDSCTCRLPRAASQAPVSVSTEEVVARAIQSAGVPMITFSDALILARTALAEMTSHD